MRTSPTAPTAKTLARLLALSVASTIALGSTTALAAQPAAEPAAAPAPVAAPAPAPAPAPASPTTVTTVPGNGGGQPVIVVNTNVPVSQPAPAPAPAPTWEVHKVEPTPAPVVVAPTPAPVFPDHITVDLKTQPQATPTMSPADHARLRLVADSQRARGLMIAGWATFGSTYAFSALTGTIAIDTSSTRRMRTYGAWMTIPVAGPFAAAFYTRSATGGLLTTALGVAQAGGILMALVGGVRHRRLKNQLSIAVAPTSDGGGQIGVSGRF